jgi:hypothetical protein
MPVLKVVSKTGLKVTGEANIVEFPSPIKSIDSVPPSNILADDILIFSQSLPRNILELLTNQRRPFSHLMLPLLNSIVYEVHLALLPQFHL